MNSLNAIKKSLVGKSKLERIAILKNEVIAMNEHEKEKYRKFYGLANEGLKTRKTVSMVIRELDREGLFFQSASYFPLEYALACVVTGNPVQEPMQIIREARKRKEYKPKKRFIPPIFDRLSSPRFSKIKSHSSERDYE